MAKKFGCCWLTIFKIVDFKLIITYEGHPIKNETFFIV